MKGFDILLEALACLNAEESLHGLPVHLTIIGEGPERERLRSKIRELNLTAQVTLTGYLGPSAIRTMLSEADVFVLPCRFDAAEGVQDGIPVAIIEAMAVGLPVVTTRISGIPELVENDVSGFLVDEPTPQIVAAKLRHVLQLSDEELRIVTTTARASIERLHDSDALGKELCAILRVAASASAEGRRAGQVILKGDDLSKPA